jgi:hypothetical protein
MNGERHSPPGIGGVDATSRRSREASFDGADGVVGNGTIRRGIACLTLIHRFYDCAVIDRTYRAPRRPIALAIFKPSDFLRLGRTESWNAFHNNAWIN